MRYVSASMRVGPPAARALSAAAFVAAYTARRSFPSTRTPSKPYAWAFCASVFDAVWRAEGTEIAHWLFLQKKIVGVLNTPAKFIPLWKSPSLVAPSPKYARETTSSLRIFAAHAAPTACGICVPTRREVVTKLPHAVGAAWAAKIRKDDVVSLAYFGDGATSEGDFHGGMNFAGVFKTPTIFFCKNNQWAISVPIARQTATKTIAQKAQAYGFEGVRVDGNDLLAVYAATK